MTEVPAATPETTPPETVATEVVAEVQGLEVAAVPDPVNVVVAPIQADAVPEMVGSALIVTVCVAEQPLLSVYVMTEVPAATPETTPPETVATEVVAEVQGLEVAAKRKSKDLTKRQCLSLSMWLLLRYRQMWYQKWLATH